MRYRFFLLTVTVFFVTMNVLLWRSEITGRNELTGSVPAEVVWQKILTAPDNSRLVIEHYGMKIGYCLWSPNVGEELATGKIGTDEPPPEGMVKRLSGYSLDLDGNISLDELTRARFTVNFKLTTNQALQEASVKLNFRPDVWEIHSIVAEQTIQLKKEEDGVRSERVFRLSNPQHVEKLLAELGLPLPPGTLETLGINSSQAQFLPGSLGLGWQTRNDWLQVGSARIRAYRLEASLLGRYKARLFVSHVGEILRVELPGEIVLKNDALTGLQ